MGRVMGATGEGFVAAARRFLGVPYMWGGASPRGFDCSGLVYYVLGQMGISAPRTSEAQWTWVQRISGSQLQPGDLVFSTWPGEVPPGHVAIYAGNGRIIEAPAPGQDVHEVPWSPSSITPSGGSVIGYGRIPGMSYAGEQTFNAGGPATPTTGGGSGTSGMSAQDQADFAAAGCPITLICLPVILPFLLMRRAVRRTHYRRGGRTRKGSS